MADGSLPSLIQQESFIERGQIATLALPTDRPRQRSGPYAHDRVRAALSNELASRLRSLAEGQGATLPDVLVGAWAVLLGRWSGQEDVIVAVELPREAAAPCVNEESSNYVSMHIELRPEQACAQLISQVVIAQMACAKEPRNGRQGDTQNRFVEGPSVPSVAVHWDRIRRGGGPFELVLSLDRRDGGATFALDYAVQLFDADTARRLLESYEVLLESLSRNPDAPATRWSILTAAERDRALHAYKPEPVSRPLEQLIHELFEQQAARTPAAVALIDGDERIAYQELNRRANRLARHLRRCGADRGRLVGLCVERGADMVVGMLATLKSGAAYVPMDPAYPAERLAFMIEAAATPVLLTQKRLRDALPVTRSLMVEIDGDWRADEELADSNLGRAETGGVCTDLAFVIFTSGSTGMPKGAMNEHRGMVNRIAAAADIERYEPADICSQKTSLSFVDAVFETFGPLAAGCPLVIVPPRVANDPVALASFVARQRVTRLLTVPSLARAMLESEDAMRELSRLRTWTLSGEEVRPDLLDKLLGHLPRCRFIIQYGSSEVSSDAAIYSTSRTHAESVPIGKPLPNTSVYILDRHGEPVPVGVPGEIHVAGVNVGRGYLGNAELTSQRFVRDPFATGIDSGTRGDWRMFKTGDLGRWRRDGVLEYLGRADHQVKIRGFRIELGEIEAQLLRHPRVREAAAVAREQASGDKRLIAYVTLRERASVADDAASRDVDFDDIDSGDIDSGDIDSGDIDIGATLRSHLARALPDHMVPAAIVVLARMPLTPNGKLDRRSLPAPSSSAYALARYQPPVGPAEGLLVEVWQRLLGVPRVGRSDNFFRLGGNSLLLVRMLEELRRSGWHAQARTVYATQTLADLAAALEARIDEAVPIPANAIPSNATTITPRMLPLVALDADQLRHVIESVPGGAANIQDIYPLAPLQEGIFFHHLLSGAAGDAYVRPLLLSLSSRAHVEMLIAALGALMARHDVLRTAILWENLPRPVQVVYRNASLPIEEWVLTKERPVREQLEERMQIEHRKLDLRRAPLLKLQVAADPDGGCCYALLQTHHLVFDDASLDLMLDELVACIEGRESELAPAVPYRNHVAQVLGQALEQAGVKDEEFFRRKLADIDEPTAPFGVIDAHADGHRVEVCEGGLDAGLSRRLLVQARRLGTSAATLFHAAWALVVSGTSGRDDIVFGSVLLGRMQGRAGMERTLGMFINTLPLRLRLAEATAKDLVEQTGRELAELLEHEQASLAAAQRCSGISGSVPLFTALLNYLHGAPDSHECRRELTSGIQVLAAGDRTHYPLVLSVNDLGDGFALQVQADRRVDPLRVLEYTRTALRSLTEALESAPQTPAVRLKILPEEERRLVVETFNATRIQRSGPALIHRMFEAQARRTPGALAVSCGGEQLTYDQLNRLANRWARVLIERGVRPDDRVAIYMERRALLIVAALASLKAGAGYVPIDIGYPAARVAYILEDSAPTVVLTQSRLIDRLPNPRAGLLVLDRDAGDEAQFDLDMADFDLASPELSPNGLAYVIYTSGSTGTPKGVMIEHHAASNLIHWSSAAFGITEGSRCSCVASVGFDAAVWEMWPPLCVGATLMLADTQDPDSLLRWWESTPIHVGFLPTPMAELTFLQGVRKPELRYLLVGGDRLRTRVKGRSCALVNNYGPTECTVVTTSGVLHDDEDSLHIGRPIDNVRVYVLDRRLEPVPIGVTGELYIGGAGVARGYLNRAELTAERFIVDPLRPQSGVRVFKSGDLVRWRADGRIEYVGRNDQQVKIRGLRIELGEIEAQLIAHPGVRETVVTAGESSPGENRLIAYVVPSDPNDTGSALLVEALRTHLRERLPQYMVPAAIVTLDRIPLTTNGKVDRRSLPVPDLEVAEHACHEAPEGALERLIASIWRDVLHVDRIGRDDDFFELGGHSLLATRMLGRLRSAIAADVSMRDLFGFSSVRRLAAHLRQFGMTDDASADEQEMDERDMDELLATVAALPPAEVDELLRELSAGNR